MTLNKASDATITWLRSAAFVTTTAVVGYVCYQRGKRAAGGGGGGGTSKGKHKKADPSRGNVGPRGLDALAPPIPCKYHTGGD